MRRWCTRFLRDDQRLKKLGWLPCKHSQVDGIRNDDLEMKVAFMNTCYCIAHPDLIKKIAEFQSHQTGNPTSISQKAALFALGTGPELIAEMKQEYEKRRDFVLPALQAIDGISCVRPDGAFYLFPNVSECMRELGIGTSEEFSKFLIQEARVATVPGSAFGGEGYIRISYATSMENLKEAMTRIQQAVDARIS